MKFSVASEGRTRRGIHKQHLAEEDPSFKEGEGNSGSSLWTRGRVSYQRLITKAESIATGEVQTWADIRAGARMLGEQADEEDREAGGRDVGQAEQSGAAATWEGRTGEHSGAGTGGISEQVMEANGQARGWEKDAANQVGSACFWSYFT